MSTSPAAANSRPMSTVDWLIVSLAALGFAFDTYELLVFPLVAQPALGALLGVSSDTASGNQLILSWTSSIVAASAICGGTFGLLGGYLTDRLGRGRVLTWSILLYAFSALASGLATSPMMLLVFRCTTFIGVCVEFVAAVAWLSELFPDPKRREAVLGYTQAFASVGGLLVTAVYLLVNKFSMHLPEIYGGHEVWRYTLISGLIPAIPLILIRPFLPESPVWERKRAQGTLRRPSFAELFQPHLRRTTIVTALLFACCYGAAFGALQLTPQIVPGLVPKLAAMNKLRGEIEKAEKSGDKAQATELRKQFVPLNRERLAVVGGVNLFQEIGGLCGRFALAFLAVRIVSRRALLWMFQVPGLIILPLVYAFAASGALGASSLMWLKIGIFAAAFCTIAQFSFWGNYLPRVYPMHLRGTGEGFAANVGGRMFGTLGMPLSASVAGFFSGLPTTRNAYAAAVVGGMVYLIGVLATGWLKEPDPELDER